eukprot:758685_1
MGLFDPSNWIWIAAFFLGAVILAIVLCVIICLCRRRCAKRRIREALQIQENYLGSTPTNKTSTNSVSNKPITSLAPVINMKSVTMLNVAEESDDDNDNENDIDDEKSQQLDVKPKSQSQKHRILDLSSDVIGTNEMTTNINVNNGISSKQYKNKRYAQKKGVNMTGSTPMMKDTQINQSGMNGMGMMETINNPNNINVHQQQTSFVLDSDLDYYAQIQQMGTTELRGRNGSEYTTRTKQISKTTNTDIMDDDEDPDVEFDYGSQI